MDLGRKMTIHSWTHKPEMVTDCGIKSTDLQFVVAIEEVIDEDRTDCVHCLRKRIQTLENAVYELSKQVRYLGWRG